SERLGEDIGVTVSRPEGASREQFLREARALLANEVSIQLPESNFCFTDIPLNANGKFDRKEALRVFLQNTKWNFPVDVRTLQSFLPHRGKAIWVDSVLEVSKNYGLVEVIIKEKASYFSGKYVRASTAIEWVAQAYGYTRAMSGILGNEVVEQANKTFIAEVKSCDFLATKEDWKLQPGLPIRIEVKCTHDFGSLKVVNGKVFKDDKVFANLNVKLYSSQ
ncbi:MAG: hypothetical protein AB7O96_05425, partial [Pseudobdellovibrionaceae bacterium]